jgi:16S rRNA (cytosine1402-N4)-methyltransferase
VTPTPSRSPAQRLAPFGDRVALYEAVYDETHRRPGRGRHAAGAGRFSLDLGLSSMQIDRRERGFAYAADAPLDMRMSPGAGRTAADVLNTASAAELTRILRVYGEERFADRIARAIVAERASVSRSRSRPPAWSRTISGAIPAAARHTGGHPAKRTFQALRIEVNRELAALEGVLPGRLGRPVARWTDRGAQPTTRWRTAWSRRHLRRRPPPTPPRGACPWCPRAPGRASSLLTRGAERPSDAEAQVNPRAASARLRAVERREGQR